MRAIDAIKAHYVANEKQFIDVPEWGSDQDGVRVPLRIYWNLLVLEERAKLMEGRDDVDALVFMARDGDGKPMFDLGDKPPLRKKADVNIIRRVVTAMIGQQTIRPADVDAAEKN